MIVDHKSSIPNPSTPHPLHLESSIAASTLERKLSVELPSPRQIYTTGSTVSGVIHLGTKGRDSIQEVQVSLVCVVRSMHHRYYGGNVRDVRRETNNLLHENQTLWSRTAGDSSDPPSRFAFQITIPEFGNDVKAKNRETPLPPSFYAGKHRGWRKMMTYGTPIGYVKYLIKACVVRKGSFKSKERAYCPFVFLPPSPPAPILPTPPELIPAQDLDRLNGAWDRDNASANLRHGIFSPSGQATLTLWIPHVPSFPRLMCIPFILCLALQTLRTKNTSATEPPSDAVPPPAQLDKASLHFRIKILSCARRGVQHHIRLFDENATDNFLHGITPQEGSWTLKKGNEAAYWEKEYLWHGLWSFKDTPNFANRQLTWTYALVAEVPIKGLGNGVKLVSRNLEVSSGITAGINVATISDYQEDALGLPPDYFEIEASNEDENERRG